MLCVFIQASYTVNTKGKHGYDNENDEMKSFFVAQGPDFKCSYKQDSLLVTDIYPLMCHILGLAECHENSGNLTNSRDMLLEEHNSCLLDNAAASVSAAGPVLVLSSLILSESLLF